MEKLAVRSQFPLTAKVKHRSAGAERVLLTFGPEQKADADELLSLIQYS
jgi:hypothetical protein